MTDCRRSGAEDFASDFNSDRILRMFARFTSVGYVAYLVMLFPSITTMAPLMDAWWTPVTVVLVFGLGLLPGALSFGAGTRMMRASAAAAAAVFLLAVAMWPLAWNGPDLLGNDSVWLAAFPGLASLAAVIACPTAIVFTHMVIGCVGVQLINVVARDGASVAMLIPEISFAIMFCTLFVGGAVMAKRTGRLLDSTTEATYTAAADAAAQRSRTVERERFDALIHDSVLSTLLSASRGQPQSIVSGMAQSTIAELDDLRMEAASVRAFTLEQAITHLRAAAADADDQAAFEVNYSSEVPQLTVEVAGEGVRVLGSALSEALRNSRIHAGATALRTVNVSVTDTALDVDVVDDGIGFDRTAVPPHRLGIAVSIIGRMNRLAGGAAHIHTSPGSGTRVHLQWVIR